MSAADIPKFFSVAIFAILPLCSCALGTTTRNFGGVPPNSYFLSANIVGQPDSQGQVLNVDSRVSFQEFGPRIGLTSSQIRQTDTSMGYVVCPGRLNHNPAQSEGAIVGDGGAILTVAHSFIDENGVAREPLSECYFENQTEPFAHVPLNFSKDSFSIFSQNPFQ